jgi:hypothetical protein
MSLIQSSLGQVDKQQNINQTQQKPEAQKPANQTSSGLNVRQPIAAVLSRQLPLPVVSQLVGNQLPVTIFKVAPNGKQADFFIAGKQISVELPPGEKVSEGDEVTLDLKVDDDIGQLLGRGRSAFAPVKGVKGSVDEIAYKEQRQDDNPEMRFKPKPNPLLSAAGKLLGQFSSVSSSQGASVAVTAKTKETLKRSLEALLMGAASSLDASSLESAGAELALAMKDNVDKSGIFYESHLRQWLDGKRSLQEIRNEMQNRFALDCGISEEAFLSQYQYAEDPDFLPLPREVSLLVGNQFAAIESGKIDLTFQGLLDQPVRLSIQKPQPIEIYDPYERDNEGWRDDDEARMAPKIWRSELTLDLPVLGLIQFELFLYPQENLCFCKSSIKSEFKEVLGQALGVMSAHMRAKGFRFSHE